MFESFEKQKNPKSVVQPVLALVVHAGLISLALRGTASVPHSEIPISEIPIVIFRTPAPLTGGSPVPGGTPGLTIVSVPIDMHPDLTPLTAEIVTVPIHRPGTFDPRPLLPVGAPDSVVGGAILFESDLTDPPRALHLAEPRYPEALRQAGIEGSVTVTYIVDPSGFVEPGSIRIVSSDQPAFAEAVATSVGQARFTPGRVRGRAVRVLVRQIIRFATTS